MRNMGMKYGYGELGLPVDQGKCIDLLCQSADLGNAVSQYQLGNYHLTGEMGLEQNKEEALQHYQKAAECGDLMAWYTLGVTEHNKGNRAAALRRLRVSASGGLRRPMDGLIAYFENGLLQHGDLAETLQAFYRSRAEMKSKERDKCIVYFKETGKYKQEYDC